MALRLYHDPNATEEITPENPDRIRVSIQPGGNILDERQIYIKSDDPTLMYDQIELTSEGDAGIVTVEYAPDVAGNPGAWAGSLTLPEGDYETAVPVWRRMQATNVENAFRITGVSHRLDFDEYVGDD